MMARNPISTLIIPAALACVLATAAHGAEGYSWQVLPNAPVSGRHDDLHFVDPLRGWVVNGDGQVWHTTDGGESWVKQLQVFSYLRCIYFVDDQLGFVGSLDDEGDGLLYRTTNGGASWTLIDDLIPEPRPAGICGLRGAGDFVFGSGRYFGPPRVIRSTDRGATWTSMDLSAQATNLIDCYFVTPDTGFVVGGSPASEGLGPRVLSTFDGGLTWQPRYTGAADGDYCWKIFFVNRLLGYISLESFNAPHVLKTTDGGLTWGERTVPGVSFLQGIGFANPLLGWVDGFNGGSRMTTDGGDTWQPTTIGEPNSNVDRFRMFSETLGYASGSTIYKYLPTTIAVVAEESPRPSHLGVANFPNPFRGATTIEYVVPTVGEVRVRLFDVLGRNVRTLVRETQSPGRKTIQWDGKDASGTTVSAGNYIVRVDAGGDAESHWVSLLR